MVISRRINRKKLLVLASSIALTTNVCAMLPEDNDISTISYLKQRAKQSDPQAQHDLGLLYKNGKNQIAKQLFKAVKWFERAALQDHQDAQLMLVRMYLDLDKEGFPKEEQKAVRWVEKLVQQNNAEAQNLLGGMYSQGLGVSKDETEAIKWFLLSAERGCVKAQFNLGNKYSKGEGIEVDIKEAIKWYKLAADQGHANAQIMLNKYSHERNKLQNDKDDIQHLILAAEQGDATAQVTLGHRHEVGFGVSQSYKKAIKWYRKAADQNNVTAQLSLVYIFDKDQNYPEAFHWAQKAAEQGNVVAQFTLGGMYYLGKGVEQDYEKAFQCYQAIQGDYIPAQCNLGDMYQYEQGVERDYDKALLFYQKGVEKNDAQSIYALAYLSSRILKNISPIQAQKIYKQAFNLFMETQEHELYYAQSTLGEMYRYGRGVQKSLEESKKWYKKGSAQGSERSHANLSRFYKEGLGGKIDFEKALFHLKKANTSRHDLAQYNLALMLRDGEGVEQNDNEAVLLFEKASKQKNPDALFSLGWMYEQGRGVEKDLKMAQQYYEQGRRLYAEDALYSLGRMYELGLGIPQNTKEALKWYTEAAYLSYEPAQEKIEVLQKLENVNSEKNVKIKFAVIGDYGQIGEDSKNVAKLVNSWEPDFIITTGDNNYPSGQWETVDENIGPLYSSYIYPYQGLYKQPPDTPYNRFFPCLGNSDFETDNALPYLKYFNLPHNGYYYDFIKGSVHFFSLCSDQRCPDGVSLESKQLLWLKEEAQKSHLPWKIVYFHHPAYSSELNISPVYLSTKNSERTIDAPFSQWAISAVLTGHQHVYERFNIEGVPYIINGLGGAGCYNFCDNDPESLVQFSGEHGGMLIEATNKELSLKFMTISGKTIDSLVLKK